MTRQNRAGGPVISAIRACVALLLGLSVAASGCASFDHHEGKPLVPAQVLTQTGPYRIWTNEPLAADAPMVRELALLEQEVQRELGVRVDAETSPIEVYILDNEKTFQHFLRFYYPELPSRRAFFLARGDRRVVYAYFGDRVVEDLRHEATHALLNGSIPNLPLWLDEGLAEYYETDEGPAGINREHLARLPADRARGWIPDLARLEHLKDVRDMMPLDYRESWAWTHYLLSGSDANRAVLLGYLADLKTTHDSPVLDLAERLRQSSASPVASQSLLAHLDSVERGEAVAAADHDVRRVSERALVYRLQNPVSDGGSRATESTPPVVRRASANLEPERGTVRRAAPPQRRGLLGAFLDLFR